MATIDNLLDLLQDGQWHDLKQTTQKVGLYSAKAEMVISFLNEYGFIKLSEDSKQIKLQHMTLEFFAQIKNLE